MEQIKTLFSKENLSAWQEQLSSTDSLIQIAVVVGAIFLGSLLAKKFRGVEPKRKYISSLINPIKKNRPAALCFYHTSNFQPARSGIRAKNQYHRNRCPAYRRMGVD